MYQFSFTVQFHSVFLCSNDGRHYAKFVFEYHNLTGFNADTRRSFCLPVSYDDFRELRKSKPNLVRLNYNFNSI